MLYDISTVALPVRAATAFGPAGAGPGPPGRGGSFGVVKVWMARTSTLVGKAFTRSMKARS
jgi:hypothetical protein